MNLNYAIFRSEPINTLGDLAQIGSHNKREKKTYNSNPDIDLSKSKNNIELVPLNEKYVKGFYNITKEYKKEHDDRNKTMRSDRKKTFRQMVDKSRSVVADELLFTATNTFFKNMDEEDIKEWAETCMEFVYKDLGYKKEQILHATVHMDEKTPHIHCVVVPLIKKFDKRTNKERYTISKKQYIKDKVHLSELQDKYHKRLTEKGYDLERGIKGSDRKHIPIKEYKKINRKLEHDLNVRNNRLDKAMSDFEEQMKTNKSIPFDKKHILIEKDTFASMNNVINETKKAMEIEPKIRKVFEEVNNYTYSYGKLKQENNEYKNEIEYLREKNNDLMHENTNLKNYIYLILEYIKKFFRKLLKMEHEPTKELATKEIKDYYDNKAFNKKDIVDIAKKTTKEQELFNYVEIPRYMAKDKDDLSL